MNTKLDKIQTTVLLLAGTLLIVIGALILTLPVDFYASNNIELEANVSLLNELKAPAGLLLAAGAFMIGAIFVRSQVDTALWLAALIYLSYAVSRFTSMAVDGAPAAGLVQAALIESVVGLGCLAVLMIGRTSTRRGLERPLSSKAV